MKYLLFSFATVALLVACSPKTTEIVTVEENSSTTEETMPKSDIAEGKVIFLEDCITCHTGYTGPTSVDQLQHYTKEQIDAVLPRMSKNAELDPTQIRQVTAYLHWKLEN